MTEMMRLGRARRGPSAAIVAALLAILVGSCSNDSDGTSEPSEPSVAATAPTSTAAPSPTEEEPDPLAELVGGSEAVTFESADGTRLEGRVFGSGRTAIVLSHMGPGGNDQSSWFELAALLADHGYRVLTYNFQGNCLEDLRGCSEGSVNSATTDDDILGAMAYLRDDGARRVILGGASIGAMASLVVASLPDTDVAGVIELSGVELALGYELDRPLIQRISAPKLFVAGEFDGSAADAARHWYRWAREPKELHVLDTGLHGTDMLTLASSADAEIPEMVRQIILDFLSSNDLEP
jgi:predicted alpha/beta-hydrolase family hydrolase